MSATTERLILRQWRDEDRRAFAEMNVDARVMRYFPRRFSRAESDRFIDDNAARITRDGWGNWAVEIVRDGRFAGFIGLSPPPDWHPCAGEVEIGWRLRPEHWGFGYATEGARVVLEIGFTALGLDEIVSCTSACNAPSRAVMSRLGMRDDGRGFAHPRIPDGSPLRAHVVYRLSRARWASGARSRGASPDDPGAGDPATVSPTDGVDPHRPDDGAAPSRRAAKRGREPT